MKFNFPKEVTPLFEARNNLAKLYSSIGLKFSFDGNLVGDLGETVASELFRLTLRPSYTPGIDATAEDGRTVQIKATTTGRGPAFRYLEDGADHLIFLGLKFEKLEVQVIFNGPERIALSKFPHRQWEGQRSLTANQIIDADRLVHTEDRVVPVATPLQN